MHIKYFKYRIKKGRVSKLSSRKVERECGICESSSNKWLKGPGGFDLCNRCGLRYLQVLAIEDPYKLNPNYINQVSPMVYIKIIFILSHMIPISRLKQIFLTLYESLNCITGLNNNFYLIVDGYTYLKVQNNIIQFYR